MAELPRYAAVIGGGRMGADIALVLVRGGCRTFVVETSAERRGGLTEYFARAAAVSPGTSGIEIGDWNEAPWPSFDLAVECVAEDLATKRAVFAELTTRCRRDTLIASNSSSLPISRIAADQPTVDRMLGWHFFYPANVVPLVEIILGAETSAAHADTMAELSRRCRLVPIVVNKDVPGFVANRLQHALAREAYSLIEAGVVSPEDVDRAVRFGFGFRYLVAGPLLQRDHGGLDVHAAAIAETFPTLANTAEVPRLVRDRVAAGKLGLKSGEGFYKWTAQSAEAEKWRYEQALQRALEVLREDISP
jgi:3-hydroxybutyryl-CoA dehydrogenase